MTALKNLYGAWLMSKVAVTDCVSETVSQSVSKDGSSVPKSMDSSAIGDRSKPAARSFAP